MTGRPQHGAAQVFPHAHIGKDVGDLKAARQPAAVDLVGRQAGNHLAAQQHAPRRRRHVSADQIEGCRFAGTVRTNQRVAFALSDAQIDIANDGDIAKTLFDSAQFDRSTHAAIPFSRATLVASSQACPTQLQVLRATRCPPTKRIAAIAHMYGLAASKLTPNALMWESSPGLTVKCTTVSSDRIRPAIIATVGTRAIR